MNKKEHQLLDILERDSRTPVATMCKQLDLSRSSVYAIINKLKEDGMIKKFTIERGDLAVEGMVKAYLVMSVEDVSTPGVLAQINELNGLVSSELIFGADDILVTVRLVGIAALDEVRVKLSKIKGVNSVVTYIVQRENKKS